MSNVRRTFHELFDRRMRVEEPHDEIVDGQQRNRTEEPPRDRVVIAYA